MQDKQPTPTKNVQRVKTELRNANPSVKVMTRNGVVTQGAREELASRKGTNFKEQEPLAAPTQLPTHLQKEEEVEPFLRACLKLLRRPQAVENLQELLHDCVTQPNTMAEIKEVHKLHSYKKCTGREMRLTAEIGHYEIDQVILDLGLDENVLPN